MAQDDDTNDLAAAFAASLQGGASPRKPPPARRPTRNRPSVAPPKGRGLHTTPAAKKPAPKPPPKPARRAPQPPAQPQPPPQPVTSEYDGGDATIAGGMPAMMVTDYDGGDATVAMPSIKIPQDAIRPEQRAAMSNPVASAIPVADSAPIPPGPPPAPGSMGAPAPLPSDAFQPIPAAPPAPVVPAAPAAPAPPAKPKAPIPKVIPARPEPIKKSLPPTSGARVEDIMSRSAVIDGGPQALRSQKLFEARRPKPKSWKPPKWLDVILGIFPGARMMAHGEVARGMAFAALGALAIFPAIWVLVRWTRTVTVMRTFSMKESWLLGFFGIAIASVSSFEGLRFTSALKRLKDNEKLPRVLASFLLPCVIVLLLGPRVVRHSPQVVEALWFACFVLAIGALFASVWSALHDVSAESANPRRTMIIGGIGVAVLLTALLITGAVNPDTLAILGSLAKEAGFQKLPAMLGAP